MSSTMSTLSTVYIKQSQRVSAAHVAGWPPSLDDTTGVGQPPFHGPSQTSQVQISEDARVQALGLDGTLETVQPMLMDKLQGNLLNMMLERLTGESMADAGFAFPSATADAFGWFAERYGVPRPPRHRPQSFTGTMASITAQAQSVQFSAKALVQDADGKNVNLSMELSMAKTSVGVSVAALQNSQMSGPQIASFGGRSSQATHASFQFNLGVLWSGVSLTAGAQTASNSHREGSPVTFGSSSRSIQRAFFRSVNTRYNDVDTQPTPPRATPSVSSVVREPAATTAAASLATAVAEPTTQELEERPTKLPKATKRWIA